MRVFGESSFVPSWVSQSCPHTVSPVSSSHVINSCSLVSSTVMPCVHALRYPQLWIGLPLFQQSETLVNISTSAQLKVDFLASRRSVSAWNMNVWGGLENGEGRHYNSPEKWVSLYTFCRWENWGLGRLTRWAKVTHLAAGWNKFKLTVLSGIIEDLCLILPIELNKKEISYLVWQYKLLLGLPRQTDHCLSAEDKFLLGRWSVTIYIFCFRLSCPFHDRKWLMLFLYMWVC